METPIKYFERICYHWDNGAYISGFHIDFHHDLSKLINQFGYPTKITRSKLNDCEEN